jgi:hypothetical protein
LVPTYFWEDVSVFFALRSCQEHEVFGPPCINVWAYNGGIYCKRKCWPNALPWCSSFGPRWLKLIVRKNFPLRGIVQSAGKRGFWSTVYKHSGLYGWYLLQTRVLAQHFAMVQFVWC